MCLGESFGQNVFDIDKPETGSTLFSPPKMIGVVEEFLSELNKFCGIENKQNLPTLSEALQSQNLSRVNLFPIGHPQFASGNAQPFIQRTLEQ